jgi:hypothetical protein
VKSVNILIFFSSSQLFRSTDHSTTFDSKIAEIYVYCKLSAMIRILVSKGEKSICIYEHLLKIDGGTTVEVSSVQQCVVC